MNPAALVADLRARGVTLRLDGDGETLRVRPISKVTAEELAVLRLCKAEVLAVLVVDQGAGDPGVARLLPMPLDVFARQGQPLEIRVSWWPASFWFVPDARHAEALCREGVARHRVWTTGELLTLLSGSPFAPDALVTIMQARRAFDGEVVEVRPR